ncbi:MAG: hypothetical protein ACMUIL_05665 [bacterium]
MGKKKRDKARKKAKKIHLADIPPEGLRKNAALYLERGQYKKAIENYKAILSSHGNHEDVLDKLHMAYAGRLRELAGKGMHREAAELWEHIAKVYHYVQDLPFYIERLIQAGDYPKAVRTLYQNQEKINDSKWFQRQESVLALFVLAGVPDIGDLIPDESLILRQRSLVQKALEALYKGDEDRASEMIRPVGMNSPYKDWKLLIKGLVAFYAHRDEEALDIFRRIPDDSPLTRIVNPLRFVLEPSNAAMPKGTGPFPRQEEISLLKEVLGDRAGFLSLQWHLATAEDGRNARDAVGILKRMADDLPADSDQELLRRYCVHFLMRSGKEDFLRKYRSLWGSAPDPFEGSRLQALMQERECDWIEANGYWDDCIDLLKKDRTRRYFPDRRQENLAIAQILRHMADNMKKDLHSEDALFDHIFGGDAEDEEDEEDFISYLLESLKFDPGDVQTYRKIVDYYKECGDKKNVAKWLERLIQVCPGDMEAVLEAASLAFMRKSFQKSLRFLERALHHDPLNEKARRLKIAIHIVSAHQRFRQKKYNLARRDFERAGSIITSQSKNGRFEIIRGIGEMAMGDEKRGRDLIERGLTLQGDNPCRYFRIPIEGSIWEVPEDKIAPYHECLRTMLQGQPTIEQVGQLLDIAFSCFLTYMEIPIHTRRKMGIIGPYLDRALRRCMFSEEDLQDICHFLAIVHLHPLLVRYAGEGKRRYPENRRFRFYSLIGRHRGMPCPEDDEGCDLIEELDIRSAKPKERRMVFEIDQFMQGRHPLYSLTLEEIGRLSMSGELTSDKGGILPASQQADDKGVISPGPHPSAGSQSGPQKGSRQLSLFREMDE